MLPDTAAHIVLEDDRARLEPLSIDHAGDLLPFSLHEPDLWTFSIASAAGEPALHQYLKDAIAQRNSGWGYPFIIYDKLQQAWAGSTRFYDLQPTHATVQLGFTWLGSAFRATGLNKHIKFLMLQHAFEVWQMERVEFRADLLNKRSIAAMKRIGCVEEGVLRNNQLASTGLRRDSIVLSILRQEWYQSVKNNLQQQLQSFSSTA